MRLTYSLALIVAGCAARSGMPLSQLIQLHEQMVDALEFSNAEPNYPDFHNKPHHGLSHEVTELDRSVDEF